MPIEQDQDVTSEDLARQTELGITSETVTIYHYKKNVYQRLSDALKYAETDRMREHSDPEAEPSIYTPNGRNHE